MKGEKGFTLAEVIGALVIMGLVVTVAAQTMTWQTKVTASGESQVEIQQALRASMQLMEREIRLAKTVKLQSPGVLKLTRVNNQQIKFYVADKDYNGVKDLYLETDGVPNPVASYVDEVAFSDQGSGQWNVSLTARCGGVENRWSLTVQQRVP